MKVRLVIDLEIPDQELSEEEIHGAVVENVVRYAEVGHLEDSIKWMANKAKEDQSDQYYEGCKHIIALHRTWADIMSTSTHTFEVLK